MLLLFLTVPPTIAAGLTMQLLCLHTQPPCHSLTVLFWRHLQSGHHWMLITLPYYYQLHTANHSCLFFAYTSRICLTSIQSASFGRSIARAAFDTANAMSGRVPIIRYLRQPTVSQYGTWLPTKSFVPPFLCLQHVAIGFVSCILNRSRTSFV